MKRMCIVTLDALPAAGGVARSIHRFAQTAGERHDVVVLSPLGPVLTGDAESASTTYEHKRVALLRDRWPRWMGVLPMLRAHPSDVVVVHHVIPVGVAALMHKRRTGTPYAVFVHGMDVELARRNAWKRWLLKQVMREAEAVVANSHALAQDIQPLVQTEVLVWHPAPHVMPTPSDEKTTNKTVWLSVGRFVERKGVDRVLRALARRPDKANIAYHIAGGDGPFRSVVERLVHELGLTDHVTLHVSPSDQEILELYQIADLFVLPTVTMPKDREGFGIVYVEAGLAKLPCIASRVPGVDEAVLDQETGWLISSDEELDEALDVLTRQPDLRAALGERGREHALHLLDPKRTHELLDRLMAHV